MGIPHMAGQTFDVGVPFDKVLENLILFFITRLQGYAVLQSPFEWSSSSFQRW